MLSFGIEYERAFSTAFARARLLAGSPPPSFAATMIARESFEKSLPRLASAAPFLCLIVDHLLCPDTHLLLPSPYRPKCRPDARSGDGGVARPRLLEPRLGRAHRRRPRGPQVQQVVD